MHPFDIKTVLLAKHAQHVVLIHFPIALYTAGVLFDFLSGGRKRSTLAAAAYFNFGFAAVFAIPTAATGLLAWHFALEGQRLKGILLLHLLFGIAALLLICLSWWIHRRARRDAGEILPGFRVPVECLGVVLVLLAAHLGGFVSGINS